ncbi:hypothetical protein QBC35DRAFT_543871 [Podospora australis]|uniref:Uncharacterized protein n=1 Tax=Podospora australis TaxID=1536484 RepID=A0AAN6WKN7_9PEZI|nr:hypothetical protein QBC35DRAFT_543871 [Podospora australis]
MNDDDEFSQLWERHISDLRHDFSADNSVRALTSGSKSLHGADDDQPYHGHGRELGHGWDERINSVVDALDELSLQSPKTTTTQSPMTPWFPPDREGFTETATSSPESAYIKAFPNPPGKDSQLLKPPAAINPLQALPILPPTPILQQKQQQNLLYAQYTSRHLPISPSTLSDPRTAVPQSSVPSSTCPGSLTPATTLHSPLPFIQTPTPPTSVSVLLLTWSPPTARPGPDGQLFSPSLSPDVESVRSCFKRRGWKVQCRLIPNDYPTSAVETVIDKFLHGYNEREKELLIIYYHGFGETVEGDGRLRFSNGNGNAHIYWDDVRDPIMQHPADCLLLFDCTASTSFYGPGQDPVINLHTGTGLGPHNQQKKRGTKQVLGVCAPPVRPDMIEVLGTTTPEREREFDGLKADDAMTRSLCKILDSDLQSSTEGEEVLSVQRLCSLIRQDLRQREDKKDLAGKVFVTQLGGGQILDIVLPRLGLYKQTPMALRERRGRHDMRRNDSM